MRLIVLTEYSPQIGFGHISRTLALSDCFFEIGWNIEYFIRETDCFDVTFPYSYRLIDWSSYTQIENILNKADVVLIDSYRVSPQTLSELVKNTTYPLTIIDSKMNYPNRGTLVFGSIYANNFLINENNLTVLSGEDFILFREDFIKAKDNFLVRDKLESIVISLGKLANLSELTPIINIIRDTLGVSIKISVVGASFDKRETEEDNLDIYPFLETKAYARVLQEADLVISNGGQTLNECIALNVPTLAIEMADNQFCNIRGWESLGVIFSAGKITDVDISKKLKDSLLKIADLSIRQVLSIRSQKALDLNGAQRVLKYVLNGIKSY